jgi:CheY-like chemotaxis protein
LYRRILLADDDDDDHLIFLDAIGDIDPTIVCETVMNGKQLLDKLSGKDAHPDALFLDINMPLLNGFECLNRLKKSDEFSHIPVVIYSTATNNSAIETARILGADLFLSKPSDHRILYEKLKTIFDILFADHQTEKKSPASQFLI